MSNEDPSERVLSIIQLVNLEMDAEARKMRKQVDPRAKVQKIRERLEAAGLPIPDHLKAS